jgi:hypothetical protein
MTQLTSISAPGGTRHAGFPAMSYPAMSFLTKSLRETGLRRLVGIASIAFTCLFVSSAWHPAWAQSITSNKARYAPNESIQIEYTGFPGNSQDWLTLVRKDAPPNTYGEWFYTQGKKTGSYQFKGLAAGDYQVRAYLNWPSGGFDIRAQIPVIVSTSATPPAAPGDGKPTLKPRDEKPAPGEAIDIDFSGFPGSQQDWITVVSSSTPTNQYAEWFYTKGQTSGRLSFKGLPPGAYEARAYFNWPSGGYSVQARTAFVVSGGTASGGLSIHTSQAVYVADQAIDVKYTGFSGAARDWITIAPAGSPHEQYGEWYYTSGARDGSLQFQGLPPGAYEVRGYFDWPAGGFTPRAAQPFSVVENRTPLKEMGLCKNPKVLKLMDRWLATATPAEGEASAKRRFDAWGNIDGLDAKNAGRPNKAKLRRCAHLWKVAAQLRSSNQGTLKEFVEKNQ